MSEGFKSLNTPLRTESCVKSDTDRPDTPETQLFLTQPQNYKYICARNTLIYLRLARLSYCELIYVNRLYKPDISLVEYCVIQYKYQSNNAQSQEAFQKVVSPSAI